VYLCSCSLTGSDQIWYHKQLEKLYLVVGWGLTAAHALWITMFRLLCGDMCFNECLCNCCVVHGFKYIKYEFVHSSGVVVCSIVLAWLEIKKAVLFISYACYVDKLMLSYHAPGTVCRLLARAASSLQLFRQKLKTALFSS